MVEHEPGGFKIPAKAKNSGTFDLDVEKGRNTFHYDGTREKLGGSMAGWTVVTEPVAVQGGQAAVRVSMSLRTKPETAPRRFILLGTSKADFDGLLDGMRPVLAAQEGQITQVVAAKSAGQWWAGLGKVTMTKVLYGSKDGILKVVPDEGLQWSPGLGKTRIPWGAIAKIEIGEIDQAAWPPAQRHRFRWCGHGGGRGDRPAQPPCRSRRHVQRARRDHQGRQAASIRHTEVVVAPRSALRRLPQGGYSGSSPCADACGCVWPCHSRGSYCHSRGKS